jgi:signal transduction histidine kinase
LQTGETQVAEWTVRRKDGTLVPVEVSAKILGDGRWQAFVRDITERKRNEQLRSEWGSVIAHDLRQPLTTIEVNLGAIEAQPGLANCAKNIERIRNSTRRLGRMVNDLLDLSLLQARQLPLTRAATDALELVRASADNAALQAPDRPVELRVHGAIPTVVVDRDRVLQILENLLSNAIKYGDRDTPIVIDVEAEREGVAIAVTNQGSSIGAEELAQLFQRFSRGDEKRRGNVKGIGLGLYITRELVEAHGGRISAASVPGGATTFRFTLPLPR